MMTPAWGLLVALVLIASQSQVANAVARSAVASSVNVPEPERPRERYEPMIRIGVAASTQTRAPLKTTGIVYAGRDLPPLSSVASSQPPMASCQSGRDDGEAGYVEYQMTGNGSFVWGAYMWPWVDSDTGPWEIYVFRNAKALDKCKQPYPCHASYDPGVANPGSIFTFMGTHQGYLSKRVYRVGGECRVPD
jgi:hypothetical protein